MKWNKENIYFLKKDKGKVLRPQEIPGQPSGYWSKARKAGPSGPPGSLGTAGRACPSGCTTSAEAAGAWVRPQTASLSPGVTAGPRLHGGHCWAVHSGPIPDERVKGLILLHLDPWFWARAQKGRGRPRWSGSTGSHRGGSPATVLPQPPLLLETTDHKLWSLRRGCRTGIFSKINEVSLSLGGKHLMAFAAKDKTWASKWKLEF